MTDEDLARFVEIVRANLRTDPAPPHLDLDSKLPELGLDSFGTVSIIMAAEREFDVIFPDEALSLDTFETLGTAWELIRRLRV